MGSETHQDEMDLEKEHGRNSWMKKIAWHIPVENRRLRKTLLSFLICSVFSFSSRNHQIKGFNIFIKG